MIIDAHCHILPDSFPGRFAELTARDATFAALFPTPNPRLATAEQLIASMDRAGVAHAVVLGLGWSDPDLAVEVNDYLLAAARSHPHRLTAFCSVNPAGGKTAQDELARCLDAGARGLGELHPDSQGFDITDRSLLAPLMDALRRLERPVVVHVSEPAGHQYPGKGKTTPDRIYRFIRNFPDNLIICAHWGGGLPFYALMPEVPEQLRNVYFDCAASPFLYRPAIFPTVAGLVGAEKVLFASDYPLIPHRRILRQARESGLDPAAQAAILGENARRLLGVGAERARHV